MTAKWILALFALLLLLYCLPGFAAQPPGEPVAAGEMLNPPPSEPPVKRASYGDRLFTDVELQLSYTVLGFGLMALILQCVLMWQTRSDSQAVLKMSTVTLVITGTLFVITAGFSSEQIAPAMGLFGTITGYLLGRETRQDRQDK